MSHRALVLACAAAFLPLGCLSSEVQLRQRAASDFQCPPEQLTVKEVKPDVYEAAGCEQKNNYVYSKDAEAWLREDEAGGKVIR